MPVAVRVPFFVLMSMVAQLLMGCHPKTPDSSRDPEAITADGTLGTPLLLVGGERTVYARIRIDTRPVAERLPGPVNVALSIDTSGSMEGAPIVQARRAAIEMVARLKNGDRLAVIAFHTTTVVVLPSTELDDDVRAEVTQKIAELEALGTTDLAGGLDAAVSQVQQNYDESGVNRVVLLGDGKPNHPESIESTARSAASRGIAITSLGLGLDYDEVLMGKIAELSGGRFHYVESADKVAGFFKEELMRLHTVYARNASVALTAGPGVRLDAVVGAPSPPSGGVAYVPLGDIARGDIRDIVVRMTVTPPKDGAPIELLDTVITFDDGVRDAGRLERRVYFGAYASADEAKVAKARNTDVELSAALAEAGATTITALALAKQSRYVEARGLLAKGADAARAQAKQTPSAELDKQAGDMLAVAADMPETDPAPPPPDPSKGSDDAEDDMEASPAAAASPNPVAPAESLAPPAAQRRKEVHDKSYQHSH